MSNNTKFGDYLRQKREAKGWTQPEAAARAEIEQSYLSKLETGKSFPSEEVYSRLLKAFEIDTAEMCAELAAADIDRLKEIKDVRTAVLNRQISKRSLARGWLLAGLAFLMIGGACLGFVAMQATLDIFEFRYRSMGVLETGESLKVFDVVEETIDLGRANYDQLRSAQQAMIERIDQEFQTTTDFRGSTFVEDVGDGRRYFELYDQRLAQETASSFRWFYIPAFMFMLGSIGCFYIGFRWD